MSSDETPLYQFNCDFKAECLREIFDLIESNLEDWFVSVHSTMDIAFFTADHPYVIGLTKIAERYDYDLFYLVQRQRSFSRFVLDMIAQNYDKVELEILVRAEQFMEKIPPIGEVVFIENDIIQRDTHFLDFSDKSDVQRLRARICASCLSCRALDKNPFSRCSGCASCFYCSEDCHRKDWSRHKTICKFLQSKKTSMMTPSTNHSQVVDYD